jgi:hypothetical protein
VLTGRRTGTTGAFTISNALLGGMPPALADTNLDGISGDSATDNTQNASNAAFTVNGLSVTSASNAVADVVSGVTLSLLQKDPSTTVTVRVERDTSKAKDVLKKFINSYNDIMSFVKDLVTSLTSALRALDAQRCGLDVAGQNIANVNTPGYSRRTVDLATRGPDVIGAAGGGVNVIGIRSMRDQLLELRLQEEVSAQRQQQTVAGFLSVVEATLGAPGSSIDRSLDSFSMRSAGSLKRRYRQRRDKAYSCRPTAWRERSEAWLDALSRRVRMSTVKSAASSRTSIASPNGSRR